MSDSETSVEDQGVTLPSLTSESITLQVGERQFITTIQTLTRESGFFQKLLAQHRNDSQGDGSYFIDADPELFQYILRYLRRSVLPVFYDNVNGHNHALYGLLLEEATHFQIPRLEKWLREKGYLQVVKIRYSIVHLEVEETSWSEVQSTDGPLETHQVWEVKKVYICPRGIPVHRGNLNACGRQCIAARGEAGWVYEDEENFKVVVIRKQRIVEYGAVDGLTASRKAE